MGSQKSNFTFTIKDFCIVEDSCYIWKENVSQSNDLKGKASYSEIYSSSSALAQI